MGTKTVGKTLISGTLKHLNVFPDSYLAHKSGQMIELKAVYGFKYRQALALCSSKFQNFV